jgi:hypothetical protein
MSSIELPKKFFIQPLWLLPRTINVDTDHAWHLSPKLSSLSGSSHQLSLWCSHSLCTPWKHCVYPCHASWATPLDWCLQSLTTCIYFSKSLLFYGSKESTTAKPVGEEGGNRTTASYHCHHLHRPRLLWSGALPRRIAALPQSPHMPIHRRPSHPSKLRLYPTSTHPHPWSSESWGWIRPSPWSTRRKSFVF